MTAARITPGPWRSETVNMDPPHYGVCAGDSVLPLCEGIERAEDARAIAAVPAMVTALQAIRGRVANG